MPMTLQDSAKSPYASSHPTQRSADEYHATQHPSPSSPTRPERRRSGKTTVTFPIVDSKGELITEERRQGDRRHWSAKPRFPLKDETGTTVATNRRRRVDRRLRRTEVVEDPRGPRLPKILLDTGEAFYELTCDGDSLMLGRDSSCGLIVTADWVSRRHARIVRDGERFVLYDTSSNGTFVRPEGRRERDILKHSFALEGRGIIRLGHPIGDESEELIRYTVITTL